MSDSAGRNPSPSELEARIRDTRARLAEDIDAARVKFSKQGLRYEAVTAIRGVRDEATGAIEDMDSGTNSRTGQLSKMVVDTVKRYPGVTTLLGLGIAMLVVGMSGGSESTTRKRRARAFEATPERTPELPAPRSSTTAELPPTTR